MSNIVRISSLALLAASFVPVGGVAYAQGTAPSTELPRVQGQIPTRDQPGGDGIAANGRCGGVSTGTGQRRCGDLSGGPSGGNSSKN